MVSEKCAESIRDFVYIVNPTLTPEEITKVADTTLKEGCKTEFKDIFINENSIKKYNPGVRDVVSMIRDNPDVLRPNSYIQFTDNVLIIADAEGDPQDASRIVHAVVTTTEEDPLSPSCGRVDTNQSSIDEVVQYKFNTDTNQCIKYLKDIL